MAGHCWPVPPEETFKQSKAVLAQSFVGVPGSWYAQGFVWALWVSLLGMGFGSKWDFVPHTVLLGLLLCSWLCGIIFWWDPTFSCWWLFSGWLQFWNSYRRRWVHVLLFHHLVPKTGHRPHGVSLQLPLPGIQLQTSKAGSPSMDLWPTTVAGVQHTLPGWCARSHLCACLHSRSEDLL